MPTAVSVGNTDFREIARQIRQGKSEEDHMTVIWRGRSTALSSKRASHSIGDAHPDHSDMFINSMESVDAGPVSDLILNYVGILTEETANGGVLSQETTTRMKSVRLATDSGDLVNFKYLSQGIKTTWISRKEITPRQKFKPQGTNDIERTSLIQPDPPVYSGSITSGAEYTTEMQLASFEPIKLAPKIWKVIEVWEAVAIPAAMP